MSAAAGMHADVAGTIRELVDRETHAWDTQDVDLLNSLFHPGVLQY